MKHFTFPALLIILLNPAFSQIKQTLTINFDFNKYDLVSENRAKLDSFLNKISQFQINTVSLSGYCDSKGSHAYNEALSIKRVNTIKAYLENKKNMIAGSFIEKGVGENGLLNSDATAQESHQNRRVEIMVLLKEELHKSNEQIVSETKKESKSLTTILEDTIIKKGSVITIPNLEFENNLAVLLPGSMPVLLELFNILSKNPKMEIAIEGHICCVSQVEGLSYTEVPNFQISVYRAKMVYEYLINKGISPGRLTYTGFGSSRPIFPIPEKTEEERIANRRVEIRITEK